VSELNCATDVTQETSQITDRIISHLRANTDMPIIQTGHVSNIVQSVCAVYRI